MLLIAIAIAVAIAVLVAAAMLIGVAVAAIMLVALAIAVLIGGHVIGDPDAVDDRANGHAIAVGYGPDRAALAEQLLAIEFHPRCLETLRQEVKEVRRGCGVGGGGIARKRRIHQNTCRPYISHIRAVLRGACCRQVWRRRLIDARAVGVGLRQAEVIIDQHHRIARRDECNWIGLEHGCL